MVKFLSILKKFCLLSLLAALVGINFLLLLEFSLASEIASISSKSIKLVCVDRGICLDRGQNVPDCLPVSSDRQNIFCLSPPTSNLILFYFHFLKLEWGCTIIDSKLIEKVVKTKISTCHFLNYYLKSTGRQATF